MIFVAITVYLLFGVTTAIVFLHAAAKSRTKVIRDGRVAACVTILFFWPYVLFGVWLANWLDR